MTQAKPLEPHPSGAAIMVASAAAVGGFLFGYDTSVINGTVDALEQTFNLNSVVLGFVVSSALLGCAVGAWFAGPLADRLGRVRVMLIAAGLFIVSADRFGSCVLRMGPDLLARHRRSGRRRGQCHRSRLHRRDLARRAARPARLAATARHRLGHLRGASRRLHPGRARGRRRGRGRAVGRPGLALDVRLSSATRRRLRCARFAAFLSLRGTWYGAEGFQRRAQSCSG